MSLAKTLFDSAMNAVSNGNHAFAISEMDEILEQFPESEEAERVRLYRDSINKATQELEERSENIILTTETAHNLDVNKRLGIVTAECVYGMNIFKDLMAGVRDVVGGKSKTTQTLLKDARNEVLAELKKEAGALGADAVVGLSLNYSEFTGGGKSMLIVVATGTAVEANLS